MKFNINLLKNGEWANETVLNRPILDLVTGLGDFTPGTMLTTGDLASQAEVEEGKDRKKLVTPYAMANLTKTIGELKAFDLSPYFKDQGIIAWDLDINTLGPKFDGFYQVNSSSTAQHFPINGASGVMTVFTISAKSAVQTFMTEANQTWKRTCSDRKWSGWFCLEIRYTEILAAIEASKVALSSALDSESETIAATSKAVKTLNDKITNVQTSMPIIDKELDITKEISAPSNKVVTTAINSIDSQIATMNTTIDNTVKNAQTLFDSSMAEVNSKIDKTIEAAQAEFNNSVTAAKVKFNEAVKEAQDGLNASVKDLTDKIDATNTNIATVNNKVTAVDTKVDNSVKTLDTKIDATNTSVSALDAKVDSSVTTINESIDNLKTDIANIPAGPQGEQGIQGIKGEKGDRGEKGSTITEITVETKIK